MQRFWDPNREVVAQGRMSNAEVKAFLKIALEFLERDKRDVKKSFTST